VQPAVRKRVILSRSSTTSWTAQYFFITVKLEQIAKSPRPPRITGSCWSPTVPSAGVYRGRDESALDRVREDNISDFLHTRRYSKM
jgi:hypothetical protein